VELEEWIRSIEKIFAVIEVPKEKNVTIGIFYFTREADIWRNIVKDKFTCP